jgi:2-keto-3-deoxy-L-rhamnonate aldolase RhmA
MSCSSVSYRTFVREDVAPADTRFQGPFDLAKSMNIEFGSQAHEDAIAKTLAACKANNKFASIFCKSRVRSTFITSAVLIVRLLKV